MPPKLLRLVAVVARRAKGAKRALTRSARRMASFLFMMECQGAKQACGEVPSGLRCGVLQRTSNTVHSPAIAAAFKSLISAATCGPYLTTRTPRIPEAQCPGDEQRKA